MSKAALKKELAGMDADQLRQIIMDAYSANKETKEYFEFFLNPDIESLLDKKVDLVAKELRRSKWGTSKARVTVIKKLIADVVALNPGHEAVMDMHMQVLRLIAITDKFYDLTTPLKNLAANLVHEYLRVADEAEIASDALEQLDILIRDDRFRQSFRRFILETLQVD